MITTTFLLYALAGVIVAAINIYMQLFVADNWPPSNWKHLQWDAIGMILTVCLFIWPLVLALMALDSTYQKYMLKRAVKPAKQSMAK